MITARSAAHPAAATHDDQLLAGEISRCFLLLGLL
jgi:hypothetical protein